MYLGKFCNMKFIQQLQMMILQNPFESKGLKMSQNSASVFALAASTPIVSEGSVFFPFPHVDISFLEASASILNLESFLVFSLEYIILVMFEMVFLLFHIPEKKQIQQNPKMAYIAKQNMFSNSERLCNGHFRHNWNVFSHSRP